MALGKQIDRDDVIAVLGPMIRQRNYEVGIEFVERFEQADPDNARFFASASRESHGCKRKPEATSTGMRRFS